MLRRIAFIRVAQGMGLSLGEIGEALAGLPEGRTPDRRDWDGIAGQWQSLLDRRITALQQLKEKLGACIGCGCLSLEHCALYNPDDQAAGQGEGPRYLLGIRHRAGRQQNDEHEGEVQPCHAPGRLVYTVKEETWHWNN